MKSPDRKLRRAMLKPLVRRKIPPVRRSKIEAAMQILEERAIAGSILPEVADALRKDRSTQHRGRWKDAGSARSMIEVAAALYFARRASFQEYTFLVASAAEGVSEGRIMAHAYPELELLSKEMQALEEGHSFGTDQHRRVDDASAKYEALSTKWSKAADERLAETLRELEGGEVSSLFAGDRSEFARTRERGRRSFFHNGESVAALADTIIRYEIEARNSASCKAFTAAVILLGAAVEGLLLLRCLRSRSKASRVAAVLPRKKRPRDAAAPFSWTFDTLIHVCLQAGWLPAIETPSITVMPDGLAHLLRQMRNYVHPGKVASERPWIEIDSRDFGDAETIYTTLFATMFKGAALKALRKAEAASPQRVAG